MLKLSIVIPVYNVEKHLAKCLDSVIYPELEGYEIVVVNDGSTDSPLSRSDQGDKHGKRRSGGRQERGAGGGPGRVSAVSGQ